MAKRKSYRRKCPKCGCLRKPTFHHVYPIRVYGKGKHNTLGIYLCRSCHDAVERMIPFEKMPDAFYVNVLKRFLDKSELPLVGSYSGKV